MLPSNLQKSFTHIFLKTLIGKEGKISWLETLCKLLSEIQIIGILLCFPVSVLSKQNLDPFSIFIQKIAGYLSFSTTISFDGSSKMNDMFWILTSFYFILVFSFMVSIILLSIFQRKLNPVGMKVWNNVGIIHYSIIFLIIYKYTLFFLKYRTEHNFIIFGQSQNLLFSIPIIIWIILNLLFAALFCKFLYQPFKNDYMGGQRTKISDLLILSFKVIDTPISLFIDNITVQKWVRISIMMVFTILNIKIYLTHVPYYRYHHLKLFTRFSFVHLSLVLSNILIVLIELKFGVHFFSSTYISAILGIFFIKLCDLIIEKIIKYSLSDPRPKTNNQLYWRLIALEYAISQVSSSSKSSSKRELRHLKHLYYGIIAHHKKICKRQVCECQSRSDESCQENKLTDEKFQFKLIKELYELFLESRPSDYEILMDFVNFHYETKDHLNVSMINLIHSLKVKKSNIEVRIMTDILFENVEKSTQSVNGRSLILKDAIDYHSSSQELRSFIERNTVDFISFWETFKEPYPSVQRLYLISVEANILAQRIDDIWNKIVQKYRAFSCQDHLLYGIYQKFVKNTPVSAQHTLKTYLNMVLQENIKQNPDRQFVYEYADLSSSVLTFVKVRKDAMGVISFITSNVRDMLQFDQAELLNEDINLMMPFFYQEHHKKIMVDHIENGNTRILNRSKLVFARKKDGYIVPSIIYLTVSPYCQDQLLYCAILNKKPTFDDFVLVLEDGTIDSFTENVGKKLNLNPSLIRKYNLKHISNNLAHLHKSFLLLHKGENHKLKHSDQLSQIFNKFTSTGSPVCLHSSNRDSSMSPTIRSNKSFGTNAIISIEMMGGSYLIIYQLQAMNELNDKEKLEYLRSYELISNFSSKTTEALTSREPFISDLEDNPLIDGSIRMNSNQILSFKNPFSPQHVSETNKIVLDNDSRLSPKLVQIPSFSLQPETPSANNLTFIKSTRESVCNINKAFGQEKGLTDCLSQTRLIQSTSNNEYMPKVLEIQKENVKKTQPSISNSEDSRKMKSNGNEHAVKFLLDDIKDRNSVRSSRRDKSYLEIEKAICYSKEDMTLRIIALLTIIFCLTSLGLLVYLRNTTYTDTSEIEDKMALLELSYERLFYIMEANRKVRRIKFIQDGLASNQRHTVDDILLNQIELANIAGNLTFYNSQIRSIIYKIRTDEVQKFYDLITVTSKENIKKTRLVNSFDLCIEVANSALEIYALLPNRLQSSDPDLNFILNNTLNDLIVKSQEVVNVIANDDVIITQTLKTKLIGVLLYVILMIVILTALIIRNEVKFIKTRAIFIEILMMVKEQEIESILPIIRSFSDLLKEKKKGDQLLEKVFSNQSSLKADYNRSQKKSKQLITRKKANYKGASVGVRVNIFCTLLFFSIFGILFGIIISLFDIFHASVEDYKEKLINSKINFLRTDILFTGIYEIVAENGTTKLMNQPISSEWEFIYNKIVESGFYSTILYENIDPEIEIILRGDLCQYLFRDYRCESEVSRIASKGLLALNNHMLKFLRGTKDFFENSNRTIEAQRETIGKRDFLDLEILYELYIRRSYQQLNKSLMKWLLEETDNVLKYTLVSIIISGIIFILAFKFIWMNLAKRMWDERKNYNNMARLIPVSVIINNKQLKNYILKKFQNS